VNERLLACTVRGCGQPLERVGRTLACPAGHSYDIARSGHVNLLQPQDRRSLGAGDSKEVVAARGRLMASGVGQSLSAALVSRIGALTMPEPRAVVDLGCGPGHALAAINAAVPVSGIGIDVSAAAIDQAARSYPALTWVVANADRRLPLLDGRVSVVLSLHARRNPAECLRILAPGGLLIVAVPAPDDLIELRAIVQGQGLTRDRVDTLIAAHAPFFAVEQRETVRDRQHLSSDVLRDLLRVSYRGARHGQDAAARALAESDVTLASDLVVFAPRR
jgi:23S rRNA (guanine745-N1)-methyltransferase